MTANKPPVVDLDDLTERKQDATVWGVVLAAGTSSRYGDRNKLLESVDGVPLVRQVTRTLKESNLEGITVVIGHEGDRVRCAISDLDVEIRKNHNYALGQSRSVRIGVEDAQTRNSDAVLIALGDMPRVSRETIDLLIEAYERGAGDALAAAADGQRGNPVVFDSRFYNSLLDIDGDTGGRQILLTDDNAVLVETDDRGVLVDVDCPADIHSVAKGG